MDKPDKHNVTFHIKGDLSSLTDYLIHMLIEVRKREIKKAAEEYLNSVKGLEKADEYSSLLPRIHR